MPLARLAEQGGRVLVAKYELSPGNHLAMLAGGGTALADRLVKGEDSFALADDEPAGPPDLDGLSCRWQPYPSLRGRMLTLLVRALDGDSLALQQEILARLAAILADAGAAAPIQRANMRFIWPPKGLRAEALLTHGQRPRWQRRLYLLVESFLQLIAQTFDLKISTYDAPAYREELRRNSDHRKVADTLHMVLDCTAAEVAAIEACLAELHAARRIVYGTHQADSAMMTCLVFSLADSRHVHFIDGADGGYALAALQLKSQLQALASSDRWDRTFEPGPRAPDEFMKEREPLPAQERETL